MNPRKKTLYFTFGNHMHWTDMQWLWGYHVLPGSVRDMLHLIAETGTKGCVNFDGIGYEKMASECPEALAELRAAVQDGRVEVVGASYGQPYGLFHGGESNIRQRIFGIRAVMRTLGVRPRAFWEEEFDFCPQLPQILAGCGYTGACLFFQWTWHTPEVPKEPHSLILWEGLDGTRLPTLPRNDLNLHQWPEDFDQILDSPLIRDLDQPALVQWVELMPSPDWMCRSELLVPRLKALLSDPRFDVQSRTLSGLIAGLDASKAPVRRYTLDDVWHGVSLGKNADAHPRESRRAEASLLAAESLAATAGLLGRPYPRWDVYPAWELEEGWRRLLAFQHHDNHECEGLCGDIGRELGTGWGDGFGVLERTIQSLASRAPGRTMLVVNACGWPRDVTSSCAVYRNVPAFGYVLHGAPQLSTTEIDDRLETVTLRRKGLVVTIERSTGLITQIAGTASPRGVLVPGQALGRLSAGIGGRQESFTRATVQVVESWPDAHGLPTPGVLIERRTDAGVAVRFSVALHPLWEGVVIHASFELPDRLDPGFGPSLRLPIEPAFDDLVLRADHPYAISEVRADAMWRRKYPTGDWMTSPQWFEDVPHPFTSQKLLDFVELRTGRGILLLHDGHQSFIRTESGADQILSLYDPWDEDRHHLDGDARMGFLLHGPLTDCQRMRLALEFNAGSFVPWPGGGPDESLPDAFGGLHVDAEGVLATAFYRETEEAGYKLDRYAGRGMNHPYVVRLVEFDGKAEEVRVRFPGPVAKAFKTNLMGEVERELRPEPVEAPPGLGSVAWNAVRLGMRAHEIATLYLDLELGRKVPRDLDAHRKVWATVHRTPPP